MNQPQQGFAPPQTQFQSPQFTQPYNPPANAPTSQPQPGPQGQAAPSQQQAVRGSLGQGWDQGARAGGYGSAVKFPDQGTTLGGYVARTMTDSDCRQAREPSKDGNGPLKFFRKSGAPQFEFVITLNVQQSNDYPEGKATLFTSKYKLHSAVVRAMQEQGYQPGEGLREGDWLEVQRIADVQSGYGQPGHDFVAAVIRRENLGGAPAADPTSSAPATAPAPATQQAAVSAPVEYSTPVNAATSLPQIPGLDATQQALVAQYLGTQQG